MTIAFGRISGSNNFTDRPGNSMTDVKPVELAKRVADAERGGILTHPLLMSDLSYHDTTSPIHRGVFLIRHVLGRTLAPTQ